MITPEKATRLLLLLFYSVATCLRIDHDNSGESNEVVVVVVIVLQCGFMQELTMITPEKATRLLLLLLFYSVVSCKN